MASNQNIQSFIRQANKAKGNVAHFFRPVDKGSSMPSWYYGRQVEEEESWIENAEMQLKRNLVPTEKIERLRAELRARKTRLDEIRKAKKEIKDEILTDPDKAKKRFDKLADIIAESMPTRDEMMHKPKLVDPRIEAERLVHRNSLVKEYKLLGHILGEPVNVEALRR